MQRVDTGKFAESGVVVTVYSSRDSMLKALGKLLSGVTRVAMEYSPENTLTRVSRVDAGTVELALSMSHEVVSSADLMQYATHQWTPEQLSDHRTDDKLGRIVNEAFVHAGEHLVKGVTEFQVAEFIRGRFREEGIESPDGPIVAVNVNATDPHYEPTADNTSMIKRGDWLLIDLWAKGVTPDSVYTDITWKTPTIRVPSCWGSQADRVARDYITSRGYGEYFTHRLGYSIGFEVHSEAVNLDGFETHDTRNIIPGVCFSI